MLYNNSLIIYRTYLDTLKRCYICKSHDISFECLIEKSCKKMGKMRATRLHLKTTREEYDRLRFYRGFLSKFAVPSLDLTLPNHFVLWFSD